MEEKLRVLHLEDDPDYAELVRALLAEGGVDADVVWVRDGASFRQALASREFDVILSDYHLPGFSGLEALRIVRDTTPGTPAILISGTVGEEAAIEGLRAGATDYVLKQWSDRLVPAIRRAVREAAERRRRQAAEQELARREAYFRALTENALDVLALVDGQGRLRFVSASAQRVLGYAPESIQGREVLELVHPRDRDRVQQALAQALANPATAVTVEFRLRHMDGRCRCLEAVGQNLLDDPSVGGVVVTCRDVTARKQAEAALRNSERLFTSVWENSADGMRLTDAEGTIVAVNAAFCRLVGLPREQLEGRPYTVIYADTPEEAARRLERYRQRFRDRVMEQRLERRLTLHNGSVLELENTNSFVDVPDRPPLLLSLFRDLTQQKRLEEQLRQSQKMEAIGQLAGGVAHDFNNILTIIQGHASLLLASANLTGAAWRSAQQIGQAAERAAGLTRQLLTFSRRQMLQPRPLDLNEVINNLARMLSRLVGEDIQLQLHYWPHPAMVLADPNMVEQVVMNLVVNARDAMPRGGQLELRVAEVDVDTRHVSEHPEARVGAFVCLSVADTGCGIPPENLRRIFEPFFTTKETGKGTGLGLATVYGIVKQHSGWIEVESVPGQGTTFRVYLPANRQRQGVSGETAGAQPAIRGGRETILVVEDEHAVRELVCTLLESHGYRVLQAESGTRAVELWAGRRQEIDLLLTDLIMPDRMNGRELAERLWQDRPHLKVIFTSGYSADVMGGDFVKRHGLYYLQKPYHPDKLALMVREVLDQEATAN